TIREKISKIDLMKEFGIIFPRIKSGYDAAFTLQGKSTFKLPKKKNTVRIGLSIHPSFHKDWYLRHMVRESLLDIAKKHKVEVLVLPHLLSNNDSEYDLGFMKKCLQNMPKHIKVIMPDYQQLKKGNTHIAYTIKYLTTMIDILITTRYHGTIFALSSQIPCIVLYSGEYYKRKQEKALEFIEGVDAKNYYLIDLENKKAAQHISNYLTKILR
ncbi:MAG TPA: polysaccharide pyruvyl transferase family protein, partial [Candidatus Woesebacteria bacterium]|nr:polysaccharide pyruvyl transferase family protein [Candidatus Woesebacteria bacterium]